ncbi:MAG: hypothetical protein IH592_03590 [Bacteroidales bacterium]|nr:hypothetical protein [Bacteroidales bacterium]
MKKTIDINIAGQLFRIDEEAWEILKHYLGHVSARFSSEQGGEETVADIEARIAEIFGGGSEPPTLVSREMVNEMINIMGAPEDYYDDNPVSGKSGVYNRKSMYDPNSLSARTGKALSEFFRAFGKLMSAIIRVIAIFLGSVFTIVGFILLFTFTLLLFFNNAPFLTSVMEPELMNTHTLLSIVLNSHMVWPLLILTALVVIIPLAALIWLGIKMIFNIRERFRIPGIVLFVVWVASLCALGVFLSLQLSVYSNREFVEKRVSLDPAPETLWIASGTTVDEITYDETASVDKFTFYLDNQNDRLHATPELNIYGSENGSGYISVDKRACSNSDSEARANARAVEYSWRFSGDTLYLDEFFSLPAGSRWNGSLVDIDVTLPEGTEVRCVPGTSLSTWLLRKNDPEVPSWRIEDGQLRILND